jgi:hypothetical protein
MVHALREIWRVLAPAGRLLDLRPRPQYRPLDVIHGRDVRVVETLAPTEGFIADERASDAALRQVVDEGWFVPRRTSEFEFSYYWDSAEEMRTSMEANWRRRGGMPSQVAWEAARHALAAQGPGARLRCRERVSLATYQRLDSTAHGAAS